MKSWILGALVALLSVGAVVCLPGWMRARRVQVDFDALIAEHPGVRIERIRTLSPAERTNWEPAGWSTWGAEITLRFGPTDFDGQDRFLVALIDHKILKKAFPRMHCEAQASDEAKKGWLVMVLLTTDSWVSLRNFP